MMIHFVLEGTIRHLRNLSNFLFEVVAQPASHLLSREPLRLLRVRVSFVNVFFHLSVKYFTPQASE